MKHLNLLILIGSMFFLANADVVDLPNINFIARADYVTGGDFKGTKTPSIPNTTLLSYQLSNENGIRQQYLNLSKKADRTAEENQLLKNFLIDTYLAERIGQILYNYFNFKKTAFSRNTIENDTLAIPDVQNISTDEEALKKIVGAGKVTDVEEYLTKVINNNILNPFELLKRKKISLNTIVIEERSFQLLNKYLQLVLEYGSFLLSDDDIADSEKTAFIEGFLAKITAFEQAVRNSESSDKDKINANVLKEYVTSHKENVADFAGLKQSVNEFKDQITTVTANLEQTTTDLATTKDASALELSLENYSKLLPQLAILENQIKASNFTAAQKSELNDIVAGYKTEIEGLSSKIDPIKARIQELGGEVPAVGLVVGAAGEIGKAAEGEVSAPKSLLESLVNFVSELSNLSQVK